MGDGVRRVLEYNPYELLLDLEEIEHTRIKVRHPGHYIFEVCGHGSVFKELQNSVLERKIGKIVLLPGHFDRNQMMEAYGRSHCVIVPTKSTLIEGFNQVAVEAVMAGRPVIVSRQCPSLELLRAASMEVPPDDIEAYASAIQRLAKDETLYESKRSACASLVKPFFEYEKSWGYAVKKSFGNGGESRRIVGDGYVMIPCESLRQGDIFGSGTVLPIFRSFAYMFDSSIP